MIKRLVLICVVACAIFALPCEAQQTAEKLAVDLSGEWQFTTGDNLDWKLPTSEHAEWKTILVPGSWESRGYSDHDGYAWYRRAFKVPPALAKEKLSLQLGRIDDADEVYLNGTFVGATGGMPPSYYSAYNAIREYPLPPGLLNPTGENIVAVRVYDAVGDGGIMEGHIGLSVSTTTKSDLIPLDGVWSFRTGDDTAWSKPDVDKEGWTPVTVPGNWEPQGFRDYDGYAWYRKEFFLPEPPEPTDFVLLLGKIDDVDETYVNGQAVGHTGAIDRATISGDDWQKQREYRVPADVLRFGAYNTVAVRVYDGTGGGGLYEGPHALYPAEMDRSSLKDELQSLLDRVRRQ